jgi:5-enolpyruvylshikimate-3-phosphate synthase
MLAARRRRRGRRTHSRHRLHIPLKASLIAKLTHKIREPELEPEHAQETFAFTIEGDATEASYNASAGLIETYEGVTFTLDKTASGAGVIALLDYPANIHYRCNQVGNCTLVRAGAVVLSAMRINQVALIR